MIAPPTAASNPDAAPAPAIPLLQLQQGIDSAGNPAFVETAGPEPLSQAGQKGFDLLARRIPEPYLSSFRQLRGRLMRRREAAESGGECFQTLLVTSPEPGDGKTFVASNLALMLAVPEGSRVLLAEGNFDRPVFESRFDLPPGPGFRELVAGAPPREAMRSLPGMGLYVSSLGSGKPSEMEPIDFRQARRWLDTASGEFDWIVFDGPSLDSPEGEMLSYLCDGVLVVLRPGRTPFHAADAAMTKLDPSRVAGVVFNGRA